MARIAIIASSFCKNKFLCDYARFTLSSHSLDISDGRHLDRNDLLDFLQDADGALIGREVIDEDILSNLPKLKAISLYGVGFDNIDLESCSRRGINFLHAPGINADSVAEFAIGLMLSGLRNITSCNELLKTGIWHKNGGRQLSRSTVAIIGCGNIGSKVARLLKAFQCRILLNDIADRRNFACSIGAETADLETCLYQADVITLHVPLTQQTHHLFNYQTFDKIKQDCFLVNTSRGSIVCSNALKHALSHQKLAGAALDVFETEPLDDPSIYTLPNLLKTAHIAGNSREAVSAMGQAAVDLLKNRFS